MKKRFFFGSLFAAMLFTGCSSDDPGVGPNGGNSTGEPQFITVNLVTTGESGTRAEGDEDDPESDKIYEESYEEGLEEENTVTKARFYFFDENGNGANVKNDNGTYVNYLDWIPVSTDEPDMPNVEKILSATLILQTPDGDEMPKTMVVIVNPYKDLPTTINGTPVSLADLKKHVQNYAKDYATAGNFVMSNSTYASGGAEMMEVSVEGKIKPERAEALKDPVEVYVERTVAKVRLYLGSKLKVGKTLNDEVILYDPSKDDKEEKFGDKKIYVKFLGWNVTAAADASRLIKKINPAWNDKLLGDFGLWNWAAYFRSFWAVNVNATDNGKALGYQYGPFREKTGADNTFVAQLKKFDGKDNNYVYLNENASDNKETGTGATTPSQVIIAAQLVDESGNALEFAEYGSERYTLDGIKELFANNCGLYTKTVTGEGESQTVTYTKITKGDLQIKTSTVLGNNGNGERYKVYIQLADNVAKDGIWYPSNAKDAKVLTKDQANDMLKYLGSVKVWTEGYTYYYFNIEHGTTTVDVATIVDGTETLKKEKVPNYGVVRNHIYDAKVESLVGLGTPVYDPDEIIYPEKPEPGTDTYLAARIHILSWRVVNNSAKLEW